MYARMHNTAGAPPATINRQDGAQSTQSAIRPKNDASTVKISDQKVLERCWVPVVNGTVTTNRSSFQLAGMHSQGYYYTVLGWYKKAGSCSTGVRSLKH